MSKRKAPSSDNPNQDFCEFLLELADYERNSNKNIYKYNAYRKAASTLAGLSYRINSGKEARKLDGIGQKIGDKIDEFISTGKLRKIELIRDNEESQALNLLTRVSGIGPAKAHELVSAGIKTLEDLSEHKDKLNHHQLIGLKYFEDFEKKIPRSEIEAIEESFKKIVCGINKDYLITVCGSYRRGKPESGDIDILVAHPSYSTKTKEKETRSHMLKNLVHHLEAEGLIIDTISLGDVKFMGVCKVAELARRLDIRLTPCDQYHCATLYFTGSDMFNKEMRAHALNNGFTLNEYCLRPMGSTGVPGEPVPVSSEEEIFEYIDYPYKEPHERSV